MSVWRASVATVLRVLASEGVLAARNRLLDRLEDTRWRRRFPVEEGTGWGQRVQAPVLNVLPTPPSPRLGGVQTQFRCRTDVEAEARAFALLYPEPGGYRLLARAGEVRGALIFAGPGLLPPPAIEDPAFERAVGDAVARMCARAVHAEGLAGLPPASLLRVRATGVRLILSVHDFSLFCLRPHLLEQPVSRFCGYCHDRARCEACLGCHFTLPPGFQDRYRELGAKLLAAADAVVYPSDFLRGRYLDLFPGLDPARHRVIEPSGSRPRPRPPPPPASKTGEHVAYVGAVQGQKGALVFEEIARRLAAESAVRWSVFGGGDADLLRRLRRLPNVSVRGYYRAGRLPDLLARHRVDIALILSITPEAYGLTLDECLTAGVPVIAFAHGAVADRVRRVGGGILVPPEEGGQGVLAALRAVRAGRRPEVSPTVAACLPDPGEAARAHIRLYGELGLL